MSSVVAICNQALGLVGGSSITSLDDETTEANLCKTLYGPVRDSVLEAHNWTFALKWYNLPKLSSPPLSEFSNAFQLPSDVLRVVYVGVDMRSPAEDWRVEGDVIVTDANTVKCQVVHRVIDPAKYSPLFIQALAARLAADFAIPLTKSRSLMETHYQVFVEKLKEAVRRDNMQGTPRRIRSTWLRRARGGFIGH